MFLSNILTYEDRQRLLKLAEWNLIEDSPKYMEKSKTVCTVRHVRTKFGAREQLSNSYLPRIKASSVLRLLRKIRKGQRGIIQEQVSILFLLGLGVPKHPDLAQYVLDLGYDKEDTEIIKHIIRLVKHYIDNYKYSMDNHEYMYLASFTEQLLLMKKFISKSAKITKSMIVPDGMPSVMVYSITDRAEAKFELVDGYTFSSTGFPVPISPTVLRREFSAVPKDFSSYSLKSHGQYVLVFGILYWTDNKEKNFEKIQFLDTEEYEILLDQYPEYQSKELNALSEYRYVNKEEHETHTKNKMRLSHKDELSVKDSKRLEEANAYFKSREENLKELAKHEKKEARVIEKTGPVFSAKFFALDIGMIGVKRKIRTLVSTKPEVLAKSLNAWGFTTSLLESTDVLTSRISYCATSISRSWKI